MIYHMSQDFRGESGNLGGISPPNSSDINTVLGHVAWAQVVYWLSDVVKVGQPYVTMIKII